MKERTWLQKLREMRGLTQKEIADVSKVSQQHYSLIETGERRPSPELAKKIADVLGFEWTKFYESDGEATKEAV